MGARARVDLHVHSTCSDGTSTPTEIARRAAELGLTGIALADHDSVAGVADCTEVSRLLGITCVPAVELSTRTGAQDAHVLGYFVDPSDAILLAELARLREGRERRIAAMVRRLTDGGLPTEYQDVLDIADGGAVGRAHLARVLVAHGHAEDLPDAFERLIGKGRLFWEQAELPSAAQAIDTIRAAGGLPVLAHPVLSGAESLILDLAGCGLAGVEAYHAEHTPEQAARLARLASAMGLLVTGGSDYHGPRGRTAEMGAVELPDGTWEALLAARP
jgi:predicted metal-dependent phosphoesterase TrpH